MICYAVRRGCLNNVCCLKGCSVFPLDYKMAGSGSCCDNQLLLRGRIGLEDHVGQWRSQCLQRSVSHISYFTRADSQMLIVCHQHWSSS